MAHPNAAFAQFDGVDVRDSRPAVDNPPAAQSESEVPMVAGSGGVSSGACEPAAAQVLDRLRWWRTQRIRHQPLPLSHSVVGQNYCNYSFRGTRPLSHHVATALRRAEKVIQHAEAVKAKELLSDRRRQRGAPSPRQGEEGAEGDSSPSKLGRRQRHQRKAEERLRMAHVFTALYRPRAHSAPQRHRTIHRTAAHAAHMHPLVYSPCVASPRSAFGMPSPPPAAGGVAAATADRRREFPRGGVEDIGQTLMEENLSHNSRVVVLHHPPRLVIHSKHLSPERAIVKARLNVLDVEGNAIMKERSEVFYHCNLPLLSYERQFYGEQLRDPSVDENGRLRVVPVPCTPITTGQSSSGERGHLRHLARPLFEQPPDTLRNRHRKLRAVSAPVLPTVRPVDFSARARQDDDQGTMSGTECSPRNYRHGGVAAGNSSGVNSTQPPHHQCRRVDDVQDVYVFNPLVDCIGTGAFSQVYAALPILRGAEGMSSFDDHVEHTNSNNHNNNNHHSNTRRNENKNCSGQSTSLSACSMTIDSGTAGNGDDAHEDQHQQQQQARGLFEREAVAIKVIARKRKKKAIARSTAAVWGEAGEGAKAPEADADNSQRRELVEIEREVSILRRLQHSGCSRFYEALRTPDAFVIAMKMHRGSMNARQFLSRFGPPSEARAALILYQLMETINYLHNEFGLIHRDVKLENVLISLTDVPVDRIQALLTTDVNKNLCAGEEASSSSVRAADHESVKGKAVTPRRGTRRLGSADVVTADQMLRVTLIDFGLARRTRATASGPNGSHSPTTLQRFHPGRSATQFSRNSTAAERSPLRIGMPSPMPSTANMLTHFYDAEDLDLDGDYSGASSTDVSASETDISASDCSSDADDVDGRDVDELDEGSSTYTTMANSPQPSAELLARHVPEGAELAPVVPTTCPGPQQLEQQMEHSGCQQKNACDSDDAAAKGASPDGSPDTVDGQNQRRGPSFTLSFTSGQRNHGNHAQPQPMLLAALASGASSLNSSTQSFHPPPRAASCQCMDENHSNSNSNSNNNNNNNNNNQKLRLPRSNRSLPTTTCHREFPPLSTPAGAGASSSSARANTTGNMEDDDAMLLLTPCGTEKYLPPEVLEWIVEHSWARRSTTVGLAKKFDLYAVGVVAYVLLSGCFPFNATTRATLVQQQKRVPRCNSAKWSGVSATAVSFVQQLLDPDPHKRMTAREALQHPFLREAAHWAEKLDLVPRPAAQRAAVPQTVRTAVEPPLSSSIRQRGLQSTNTPLTPSATAAGKGSHYHHTHGGAWRQQQVSNSQSSVCSSSGFTAMYRYFTAEDVPMTPLSAHDGSLHAVDDRMWERPVSVDRTPPPLTPLAREEKAPSSPESGSHGGAPAPSSHSHTREAQDHTVTESPPSAAVDPPSTPGSKDGGRDTADDLFNQLYNDIMSAD